MASADQLDRLRLARAEGVGPVTFRQLLNRFGTAGRALEALPGLARRGGGSAVPIPPLAAAERELAAIVKAGAAPLFWGLAPYPSLLARIEDAPPVLIAKGHLTLFDKPAVAMVGARNASAAGVRLARTLAAELSSAGVAVVSGLARGVDAACHQGALTGGTIAAVAGGIDVHYPAENSALYEEIGARGLLLSEMPLGTVPQARHFPRRNRIISGLGLATLVVEAAARSGSLITARFAAEQGRDVLAVPGSPLDQRSGGTNQLIRDGATLIRDAADVLEAIRPLGARLAEPERAFSPAPPDADASDKDRAQVLALLSATPVEVDELVRLSGLAPAIVLTVLLELDLAGKIDRLAGARAALRAG